MYRDTYVEVNLTNIQKNVEYFINKYNYYKYYIGVVKADCYGHNGILPINAIIDGGCNYLAVASLEEALEIRKEITNIPILVLGIIPIEYLELCLQNNITITIHNLDYLKEVLKLNLENLKIHLKINTGMNRLGFKISRNIQEAYQLINQSKLILEGIYTHIYDAKSKRRTNKQLQLFTTLTKDINLATIPIVHLTASLATAKYPPYPYANGCRLGIAMYGLMDDYDSHYLPTFKVYSKVIAINEISDETVGYDGQYQALKNEKIAVVSIGYADGIIRQNTGRYVYIHDKRYPIVGNICMDMLFVKVDNKVHVNDQVLIIKDIKHIKEIAKHLNTIPYEVICSIGKRVPRIYIK